MERAKEPANDDALHEFIDSEFIISELEKPAQERALIDTVEKLPGVKNVTLAKGRLLLQYDPVEIAKEKITGAIEGAGFHIAEQKTVASSPLIDALKDQLAQPAAKEER